MLKSFVSKVLITLVAVGCMAPMHALAEPLPLRVPLTARLDALERSYIQTVRQKNDGNAGDKSFDAQTKQLFLSLIRGLKKDSPEGIAEYHEFIDRVKGKQVPELLAYTQLARYLADKLELDLAVCRTIGKPQEVRNKIAGYLEDVTSLSTQINAQNAALVAHAVAQPGKQDFPKQLSPRSANTTMDKIKGFFDSLKAALGGRKEPSRVYSTHEGATIVFNSIAGMIAGDEASVDMQSGNRDSKKHAALSRDSVPNEFHPSTNNATDQFGQGAAFAKIRELIIRTRENRKTGLTRGVFILLHNFILSSEETTQKMADLLISARQAGVPLLMSYDQFGSTVYGKGSRPIVEQMIQSGIGVVYIKPFFGERMDHRKIYFFGTGDGHVIAMTGGQGWCDNYAGPGWDTMDPVSEKDGRPSYPAGKEPWADHMRLLDGEGALQGAISFLGRYSTYATRAILKTGLGIDDSSYRESVYSRLWEMFYPELKHVGSLTAFILTNTSWDHRPVTEEWYRNLSDPDVQSIRIVQPYITDPVFRTKLKQAVETGKNIRILVPGKSDSFPSQYATKYLFSDMAKIHASLKAAGRPVGTLEFRQWQTADNMPQMIHMKYGIFLHKKAAERDMLIDGSYNATAVEGRSGEVNSDIVVVDHRVAVQAAIVFDDYFNHAGTFDCSAFEKISGAAAAIILRPFM